MLDVKQAVEKASDYLVNAYWKETIVNAQLEEVELSEDQRYWLITLSFSLMPGKRQYKIFKIDVETGEVLSMKIRDVREAV